MACPASALTSWAHVECTSVCHCGSHMEWLLQGGLPSLLFSQVPELVSSLLFREHLNLCHWHQALFERLKTKMIFSFSPVPIVICRVEPSGQKVIFVLALHHLNPAPRPTLPQPLPRVPRGLPGPWVNSVSGMLSSVRGAGRDCPGPCRHFSFMGSFLYDCDGQI